MPSRANDNKYAANRTASINKMLGDIAKSANAKEGKERGGQAGGNAFSSLLGGHPTGFAGDAAYGDAAMDVDGEKGKRR